MSRHRQTLSKVAAFTLVVLYVAGCGPSPELAVYRDGLRRIDEPLYQAHLLLMDDAVKAGLRTDADRQVVQHGIAAARSLYQQSVAADTSATQPTIGQP